jgi:ribosomal protein S18 acetylase RimI-like enzyme
MEFVVCPAGEKEHKAAIAEAILGALPDWFGIETATREYVQQSQYLNFWAAYTAERAVGFISLRHHTRYAFEIFCMGVLPDFHRHGIGRSLLLACENYCQESGAEFLTVKTLDASNPNASYAKTRQFYRAMEFRPLEVFPTLWGPANPCLYMIKSLSHA